MIDSHQHVFWHGRDDDGLVADMDTHGIALAWRLSWEIPPREDAPAYHAVLNPLHRRMDGTQASIPLSDLLLARNHHPSRFILGYCPHPPIGNAPAMLRAAAEIHGIKVCEEWKFRLPFDDPRCLELFQTAGELKMPVVLHLDVPYLSSAGKRPCYQPNWYGGTADNLVRALTACPETIFSARSALTALRRDPVYSAPLLTKRADRFLFGRDFYGNDLAVFLRTLNLHPEIQGKIHRENVMRLVPIE